MDKSSPRQIRQLEFISLFTSDINRIKGAENITADLLSRIATKQMPNPIAYDEVAKAQKDDSDLSNLIKNHHELKFKKLILPDTDVELFYNISTGKIRPYLTENFRRQVLNTTLIWHIQALKVLLN